MSDTPMFKRNALNWASRDGSRWAAHQIHNYKHHTAQASLR